MDIPRIYHGYTSIDIPCISMDIRGPCISIMYIPRISTPLDIHGISMDIHCYPMDIDQDGIYMGYTWNIPCIYIKSGFQMLSNLSEAPAPGAAAALPVPSCESELVTTEFNLKAAQAVCNSNIVIMAFVFPTPTRSRGRSYTGTVTIQTPLPANWNSMWNP